MTDSIRAFFGVRVEPTEAIDEVLEELRGLARSLRPVGRELLHVTLRFLGETDRSIVESLIEPARQIAARHSPLPMHLTGLGCFPNVRRPRVVWAGLEKADGLSALAADIETTVRQLGFKAERSAFRPHVTFARVQQRTPTIEPMVRAYSRVELGCSVADRFELIQSELTPRGSVYSTIETFSLSGSDHARA